MQESLWEMIRVKNDNPHSLRLAAALRGTAGDGAADEFEAALPLSKGASVEKRYDWACRACEHLTERYDESTVASVRALCSCNNGNAAAKTMLKCLKRADSIQTFVKLFNETQPAGWLEYEHEHSVLLCYPTCYCSCVKHAEGQVPRAWCLCTVGYARALFSQVFGGTVRAELVESVKTGGTRCAVRVQWDDSTSER